MVNNIRKKPTLAGAINSGAKLARNTILIFFVITSLFPLAWLLYSSIKTNSEFITDPLAPPEQITFSNYVDALRIAKLPRLLINSLLVSSLSTVLNVLVASLAAYMLSRFHFKAKKALYTLITACVFVPIIALMIPYYQIIVKIGLYDTLIGLILVYAAINLPISLYLLQSYLRSIPEELEEAAVLDGCGLGRRFWEIIFPLAQPGIATAGTFVFLFSWNEFIYALLLTSSEQSRTIQLGIAFFRSQFLVNYTGMFAAITITLIPMLILYILFHEKIIAGLTAGAVKS